MNQVIKNAIAFLERVQLQGKEAQAYMEVIQLLQEECNKLVSEQTAK